MGSVIASCGHKLTRKESNKIDPVLVRSVASDGTRCVSHVVLCAKCLRRAQREGCVITSEPERERWLAGIGGGSVW